MNYSNVLLIDNNVLDYTCFVDSVNENTFPLVYSSTTTRQSVLENLSVFRTIDRLGIVNEKSGSLEGHFFFREEIFIFLKSIIQTFQVKRIDFLACNTLNHPGWNELYLKLQNDTGVIVGASNDATGNLKYGGNWMMETTSEDIEQIYFTKSIEYYRYLLDSSEFMMVIKTDGFLWGIGQNTSGQLGDGTNVTRNSFVKITTSRTPKYIALGGEHTIVVMTDGSLWGTGLNTSGQLGLGNTTSQNTLQLITAGISGKTIKSVSCGYHYTHLVMTDGTLWGTGNNEVGQLGLGNYTNQTTFQQITIPNGLLVSSVTSGYDSTSVIMTNGTVWFMGGNYDGQYGNGTFTPSNILVQVPDITQVKTVGISASSAIIALTDGTLYGSGLYSIIGMNVSSGNKTTYGPITTNISGKNATYVRSGYQHTVVLMSDNSIWATGLNNNGQLGFGGNTNQIVFGQITSNINGKTPKYIATGAGFTYVLMTDGTLWFTGYMNNNQVVAGNAFLLKQALTDVMTIPGYMATITVPTAVSNVSPTVGTTNTMVTMTGTSLSNTASILFGTVPGTNLQVSENSVQVSAPANSGTVSILVRDASGNDVSAGNFTYQNPTVVSMPSSGAPQSPIVFTGTFLNTISSVRFGTTSATFTALETSLTVTVPLGSGTVTVYMSDTAGNTYTVGNFLYKIPFLMGMNPVTAYANDTVVLSGSNLENTSYVSFGTVRANTFTSSANSITVTVPSNTGSVAVSATDIYGNVATISGNFVYLVSSGQNPTPNPTPDFTPSYNSSICFPAGTFVHTDHGQVPIQKLMPGKHTLRGKIIVAVPETYSIDHLLVCVEKDALRKNSPCVQTFISPRHKIYHKGKLRAAFRFVGKHKGFSFVPYQGEKLYNVLLTEYGTMNVQGMICETLHPSNPVAKLYTKNMALQ